MLYIAGAEATTESDDKKLRWHFLHLCETIMDFFFAEDEGDSMKPADSNMGGIA